MTAIQDFCNTLRQWLAIGDEVYPDAVVTSWVRMAEETLSDALRCKEMVQIDTGVVSQQRVVLPGDWRELDFVRVVDGGPLLYTPRDEFYRPDNAQLEDSFPKGHYSISGNYLLVGAAVPEGKSVELTYYQDIPPLGDDPTWLSVRYPTLFTMQSLLIAALYAIEDDRLPTWQNAVEGLITTINDRHSQSKASGSALVPRKPKRSSFG